MKVTVLLGGDSCERDVSLASGAGVIKALEKRGHEVYALDPARGVGGYSASAAVKIGERPPEEMAALAPERVFEWLHAAPVLASEVVFIALHGGRGEDGTVQALLDAAGLRYTGSGVLGSALAMNKDRAKALFNEAGVQTAPHLLIDASGGVVDADEISTVEEALGFPVVVKPNCQGSSVGFSFVPDAERLGTALAEAAVYDSEIIVERYIAGRELTAAILGGEALPLVEIIPEGGFYDYKRKYQKGTSTYVAPAALDEATTARIQAEAGRAYRALRCRDYARVDFRLSVEGEPFCLEVNTLPGMTELSLVPMAARSVGIPFEELVERICAMALARRGR
jgi:D-alanine-D-alanine ligase